MVYNEPKNVLDDLVPEKRDPEIIAEGTSGFKAQDEVDKVLKAIPIPVETANRRRQGVITGGTLESTKLKKKMLLGKKKKDTMKEKLPKHIRKAYITINDKKPSEPIKVEFSGDWSGSDLNLAGKHLILEYNLFVRNRSVNAHG